MANVDDRLDYAYPAMQAETALKALHYAVLDKDYDRAIVEGLRAIVETRMAIAALKDMKEKNTW
jgi:hypothetical protein